MFYWIFIWNIHQCSHSLPVVCDLCHPAFHDHAHVIYMDDFFTGIVLCKKLALEPTLWGQCSNRLGYQKCLVHSSRGQDNVSRKKQDGSVVAITAPPVVKDYNNNMGAIDKNDQ